MLRTRSFLLYWLPVVIWMCLIFTASSDKASYQHSSRIIGPILHWLFPHLSDAATNTIILLVRKCAHLTEYAVLALLLWRAMRKPVRRDPRPWNRKFAFLAVLYVALYASTDEIHQSFVPTRTAHFSDVVIDTIGATVAIFALWLIGRWRKNW